MEMRAPHPATHVVDTTMFWSLTGGGVRRYLQAKHAWLGRQPGWRHTIAVPGARPSVTADGITTFAAPALPGSGGYRLPLRRTALAGLLDKLQPSVIEAGDPFRVAWATLDAARRRHIPAVAYCHSDVATMAQLLCGPLLGRAAAQAMRRYAQRLYGRFDLVMAPSEHMRRRLADWGLRRVVCQPLGVDTAQFHPGAADAAWRDRLGLAEGSRLLVYAGRFAPEKHLHLLADAVDRLGPRYTLLAIGAGPRPPVGRQVRVLSYMAEPAQLATALASADAFVHAGDQETFGLSVLEAMACGLPVIARKAAGLAELVDDAVGFGVSSGTATGFAEAIEALLAHDTAPLRAAARARAEGHDWNRVLPSLQARYAALLGHAGPLTAPAAGRPAHG
jgi:alpha-1,6-mannosyltransferase